MRDHCEFEGARTERYASSSYWDGRYHRRRQEQILNLLGTGIEPGDSFLDVGCGTGEYLDLAVQLGATTVVGVDLARTYLGRLRARDESLPLVQTDGATLPFDDDAFDVVLCSEVIEHVPGPTAAFVAAELSRVGRRLILLTTPNRDAMIRRFARWLASNRVNELDEEVGHINLLDKASLISVARSAGMELDEARIRHIAPPVLGEMAHVPPRLDRVVSCVERLADRWVPSWGNTMYLSFEPLDP